MRETNGGIETAPGYVVFLSAEKPSPLSPFFSSPPPPAQPGLWLQHHAFETIRICYPKGFYGGSLLALKRHQPDQERPIALTTSESRDGSVTSASTASGRENACSARRNSTRKNSAVLQQTTKYQTEEARSARSSMLPVDPVSLAGTDCHQRQHEQQPSAHSILQRLPAGRGPPSGDNNARKGFRLKSIVGLTNRAKNVSQAKDRYTMEETECGDAYWNINGGVRGTWAEAMVKAKESSANAMASTVLLRWAMVGMEKEEQTRQDPSGDQAIETENDKKEAGVAGV